MKDLNPFKTVLKVQGASSILRMGFALSKYPHFNSAYLVKVRFSLDLAVQLWPFAYMWLLNVNKPFENKVILKEQNLKNLTSLLNSDPQLHIFGQIIEFPF